MIHADTLGSVTCARDRCPGRAEWQGVAAATVHWRGTPFIHGLKAGKCSVAGMHDSWSSGGAARTCACWKGQPCMLIPGNFVGPPSGSLPQCRAAPLFTVHVYTDRTIADILNRRSWKSAPSFGATSGDASFSTLPPLAPKKKLHSDPATLVQMC